MQESTTQTPAALREKGSGEEGLLSEKPPPPQNLPTVISSGREREGGELLYREAPLPRIPLQYICPRKRVSVMEVGGAFAEIAAAEEGEGKVLGLESCGDVL